MTAKLQILSGKKQGSVFDLPEGVDIDIGNRKSAKLSIRDPWISYNHAKINGEGGRFFIEDLGSSNGTWINGQKIQREELSPNVLIYFGKTKVKFVVGEAQVASEDLGAKPDDTPWWDKVIDGKQKAGGGAGSSRLRQELKEERRMREALEKFLQLPKGASVGDAARAGELEREVAELRQKVESLGGGVSSAELDEAVSAERNRGEKLRREQMTKIVELEGKLNQSESKVVDLEGRLKDKSEQVAKEVERAKDKLRAEAEELRGQLEEARKSASDMASGGDQALAAAREQGAKLERELDEARAKARASEEQVEQLQAKVAELEQQKPAEGADAEALDTIKSQMWAAVEEATKWKGDAAQLTEELEAAHAEAEKWKEEHAQIVQEIDEISMEQIDVEEELSARIAQLEGLLQAQGIEVPAPAQAEG
jgi:pSer/pThr/pTyr-binding forkhead associated (FHA) protein